MGCRLKKRSIFVALVLACLVTHVKHDEWVTHRVVLNFKTFYMLLKNLEYILDNINLTSKT